MTWRGKAHWRRCAECGRRFKRDLKPGHPHVACPDCRDARRRRLAQASQRRRRALADLEASNAIAAALGETIRDNGRYSDLDPEMVRAIAAALARTEYRGDGTVDAVARRLGVSRRTVHRWRDATVVDVTVGRYVAPFAIRPGQPPTQLAEWTGLTRQRDTAG